MFFPAASTTTILKAFLVVHIYFLKSIATGGEDNSVLYFGNNAIIVRGKSEMEKKKVGMTIAQKSKETIV